MTTDVPPWMQVEAAVRSLLEFLPHGILLRVDDRLCVAAAAGRGLAHISAYLSEPKDFIGQPLHAVMAPAVVLCVAGQLRAALAGSTGSFAVAVPAGGRFGAQAHRAAAARQCRGARAVTGGGPCRPLALELADGGGHLVG
jgi:hypothetical protein